MHTYYHKCLYHLPRCVTVYVAILPNYIIIHFYGVCDVNVVMTVDHKTPAWYNRFHMHAKNEQLNMVVHVRLSIITVLYNSSGLIM